MSEPLQPFAAWEAYLTKQGYIDYQVSQQGSVLFICEGKQDYRVSPWEPNAATEAWLKRTGAIDARCLPRDGPWQSSDLPEFGLVRVGDGYHDDLTHVSKSMLSVFADSPVKYRAMGVLSSRSS